MDADFVFRILLPVVIFVGIPLLKGIARIVGAIGRARKAGEALREARRLQMRTEGDADQGASATHETMPVGRLDETIEDADDEPEEEEEESPLDRRLRQRRDLLAARRQARAGEGAGSDTDPQAALQEMLRALGVPVPPPPASRAEHRLHPPRPVVARPAPRPAVAPPPPPPVRDLVVPPPPPREPAVASLRRENPVLPADRRWTPIQRAIVLTEILGPPRGV